MPIEISFEKLYKAATAQRNQAMTESAQLAAMVEVLTEQNEKLRARVAELEVPKPLRSVEPVA